MKIALEQHLAALHLRFSLTRRNSSSFLLKCKCFHFCLTRWFYQNWISLIGKCIKDFLVVWNLWTVSLMFQCFLDLFSFIFDTETKLCDFIPAASWLHWNKPVLKKSPGVTEDKTHQPTGLSPPPPTALSVAFSMGELSGWLPVHPPLLALFGRRWQVWGGGKLHCCHGRCR